MCSCKSLHIGPVLCLFPLESVHIFLFIFCHQLNNNEKKASALYLGPLLSRIHDRNIFTKCVKLSLMQWNYKLLLKLI